LTVIWLSVPVTLQALLHGKVHEPDQVSAAVPVPPFICAMRAAKVPAVCAVTDELFAISCVPATAARSADRCMETWIAAQEPTSTPIEAAMSRPGVITAIQIATAPRRALISPLHMSKPSERRVSHAKSA
jgi:hypothetical protein